MIILEFILELKILCFKPVETYDLICGTQSGKICGWCNIPAGVVAIFIINHIGHVDQVHLLREALDRKIKLRCNDENF